MKLTIAEATMLLSKQFGTDVEIEIPTTETASDGWIVNTKTTYGRPRNLSSNSRIELIFNTGEYDVCYCGDWLTSWWDTTRDFHIAKYRVVK